MFGICDECQSSDIALRHVHHHRRISNQALLAVSRRNPGSAPSSCSSSSWIATASHRRSPCAPPPAQKVPTATKCQSRLSCDGRQDLLRASHTPSTATGILIRGRAAMPETQATTSRPKTLMTTTGGTTSDVAGSCRNSKGCSPMTRSGRWKRSNITFRSTGTLVAPPSPPPGTDWSLRPSPKQLTGSSSQWTARLKATTTQRMLRLFSHGGATDRSDSTAQIGSAVRGSRGKRRLYAAVNAAQRRHRFTLRQDSCESNGASSRSGDLLPRELCVPDPDHAIDGACRVRSRGGGDEANVP